MSNPRCLSYMASYDVAGNVWRALSDGVSGDARAARRGAAPAPRLRDHHHRLPGEACATLHLLNGSISTSYPSSVVVRDKQLKVPVEQDSWGTGSRPWLQGEVEHSDSVGNNDVIGPGDVQWMTAARGGASRHSLFPFSVGT
jgi:hypothetical protein